MVLLLAQQGHALGLGEMRVQSYLGEPLRAQVFLSDLGGEYEASLQVRLAGPEEYRKAGLAYPYDKKYRFEVVNEDGRHPKVKISSLRAIEDPFLNLLVEVISPTGMIIKNYTILIDPTPEYYRNQALLQSATTAAPDQPSQSQSAVIAAKPAAAPDVEVPATVTKRDAPVSKTRKRSVGSATRQAHHAATKPNARYVAGSRGGERISDKLSLSLSTSLSISASDPSLPLSPKEANDALQEELIAKEKTLQELNLQIAEMQSLIKGLQIKLSMTAGSGVPGSGVGDLTAIGSAVQEGSSPVAASQISAVSAVQPAPVSAVVTSVTPDDSGLWDQVASWYERYGGKLWAALGVIVLGAGGYFWWRKRRLQRGWIPGGLFDDLAVEPVVETPKPETKAVTTPVVAPTAVTTPAAPAQSKVAVQKLAVGEQSMKVPAFKDQKAPSTLPPEYDLLEEANIYLRFGHDKLAEEVLQDALKINPKNPDIYMTLLGIYDTRNDAQGFENVAKEFKVIADEPSWAKVAEMGKKIDIGNSLYD